MHDEHLTKEDLDEILSLNDQDCNHLLFHLLAVCPDCYAASGYILDLFREGVIDLKSDSVQISFAVSRKEAPRLLEELRAVPAGQQQTRVRAEKRFWSWGLCELLCRESEREASGDPEGAVALARMAVDIASALDKDEQLGVAEWLDLLRAYTLAHLGHAYRVLGDLRAAETAFLSALDLWTPAFKNFGDVLGYAAHFLALLTCLEHGMVSTPTPEGVVKGGAAMSTYLLILRRNQAEPFNIPQEEMFVRFQRFTESLQEKGVLRSFQRLKPSAEGTTARECDGVIALEGPYDRSQDGVIGFYLIQVADQETAHAFAKQCPILPVGGSVEIRETEFFPKPEGVDARDR